jgi:hypothetical protein
MVEGKLKEITPAKLRKTISNIPKKIEIPFRDNTMKVDGSRIKLLDMFLYLTGCRISEAIIQAPNPYQSKTKNRVIQPRVTGNDLHVSFTSYEGEEVAVFTLDTLKRKTGLLRNVAIPLNPKIEPWGRNIALPLKWENPFTMNRHIVYQANRVVFNGLGYIIEPQLVKRRDGSIIFEAPKHMKPASDHFMRHIRSRELTVDYGFSDNDLMQFFGWSPVSFGKNPYMQRYQNLRWQDYFPKMLQKKEVKEDVD